jgi:hypothetical protein
LFFVGGSGGPTPPQAHASDETNSRKWAEQIEGQVKPGFAKLAAFLGQVAVEAETALQADPEAPRRKVDVSIIPTGGHEDLLTLLVDGGALLGTAEPRFIEAQVPISLLTTLNDSPLVLTVLPILPPEPSVTSQGTITHNSPAWNAAGLTG